MTRTLPPTYKEQKRSLGRLVNVPCDSCCNSHYPVRRRAWRLSSSDSELRLSCVTCWHPSFNRSGNTPLQHHGKLRKASQKRYTHIHTPQSRLTCQQERRVPLRCGWKVNTFTCQEARQKPRGSVPSTTSYSQDNWATCGRLLANCEGQVKG